MIPKFNNESELYTFTKSFPENFNYTQLLKDDFGVTEAVDNPKNCWVYLMHLSFDSNLHFSLDTKEVNEFISRLGTKQLEPKYIEPTTSKNIKVTKKGIRFGTEVSGEARIEMNDTTKKWEGFIGDTMISSSKNRDFVVYRLGRFGKIVT